jgi:putative PIN family toxin of toxin-antitoxin system
MIERFLAASAFEIVVSTEIIDEVLRALNHPKVRRVIRNAVDAALWFEDIIVLAELVAGDYRISGASDDPDDDKYIAAAVEGRASMLVTGDLDLLKVGECEGVRIITPRAFLDMLGPSRTA